MEIERIKIVRKILKGLGLEIMVLILEPWKTPGWRMSISMMPEAEELWPVGNPVVYLFPIPLTTSWIIVGQTKRVSLT